MGKKIVLHLEQMQNKIAFYHHMSLYPFIHIVIVIFCVKLDQLSITYSQRKLIRPPTQLSPTLMSSGNATQKHYGLN